MCIESLPPDDHSNMEVVDVPRILLPDSLQPRTLPQTLIGEHQHERSERHGEQRNSTSSICIATQAPRH